MLDCFTRNINCTYIQEIINFNGGIANYRLSGYPGVTRSPGNPESNVLPLLTSRILTSKTGSSNGTCNGTNNGTGYETNPCKGLVYFILI